MKQKGSKNLTYTQRLQIEAMFNNKISAQKIADFIGVNIRTVYYELKRGEFKYETKKTTFWKVYKKTAHGYSAQIAQERYNLVCSRRGRPIKLGNDYKFVEYLTKRVKDDKLSICAVLGEIDRLKIPFNIHVSKETVYSYVRNGYIPELRFTKIKKKRNRVVAKRAPKGTSIERRPKEICQRNEFGHWEMDLVVGKTRDCLLVLTERMTRKEIVFKLKNKTTISVVNCLNILEKRYKDCFHKVFKSITVDNGPEFADFQGMEKSTFGNFKRVKIYYCHPYSSYERGTNERINRDIRRIIPKGCDISKYTNYQIQQLEDWLNAYPRKIFAYATPAELFAEQMKLLL